MDKKKIIEDMLGKLEEHPKGTTVGIVAVSTIIGFAKDRLENCSKFEEFGKILCSFVSKVVSGGIVLLWLINILLILYLMSQSILKSINKSNAKKIMSVEDIVNKVTRDFDLTDSDGELICEKFGVKQYENNITNETKKQTKMIDTTSKEYWMSIWDVVYSIQKAFPEKGYLQYTNSRLKKQDKHIYDIFSDNNITTIISLMFGALSIVATAVAQSWLAIIIGLVVMVVLENYKSIITREDSERVENKLYREIIEGVLNASKK